MIPGLSRWIVDRPPFARITSMAALVITVSSTLDGVSSARSRLGPVWIWAWAAVALGVAVVPLLLGRRCPRLLGLLAAWVFLAVTAVQAAFASSAMEVVTTLILHPMVACYLGWFFGGRTAWSTFLVAVVATTGVLLVDPQPEIGIVWGNIVVVSTFCLLAVSYLRRGLERQAATDPLTGALNRAGFAERADHALEAASRSGSPLSLVLVDLDDFKLVNDRDGHAEGDRVLVELVATVRASMPPGGAVARLGGDEFAILLRDTTSGQAYQRVADLQDASTASWSHGVASSTPGDTLEALLERADAALYGVKRQRRTHRDRSPVRQDTVRPEVVAPPG